MTGKLLPSLATSVKDGVEVCFLTATSEAIQQRKRKRPKSIRICTCQNKAISFVKQQLKEKSISQPLPAQYLGQLILPFGQYAHATFQWLVENDVGYIKQ